MWIRWRATRCLRARRRVRVPAPARRFTGEAFEGSREVAALEFEHRGHRGTTEEKQHLVNVVPLPTMSTKLDQVLPFLCGSSVSSVFHSSARFALLPLFAP